MATTTPNYGWTVPTSTDLVKDGATAIETLGDAIDASMNTALGTKKAGMVLLNTTSFSAVSSVSLPANTFSSAYKNYQFVFKGTGSTFNTLTLRMRASGTDNSSNNYKYSVYTQQYLAASAANSAGGSVSLVSSFQFGYGYSTLPTYASGYIFEPFETAYTSFIYSGLYLQDTTTGGYGHYGTGGMSVTTSYDSATILASTGTITGSISIYGVNA